MTTENSWEERFDAIPMLLGTGDGNRQIVKQFIRKEIADAEQRGRDMAVELATEFMEPVQFMKFCDEVIEAARSLPDQHEGV